MPPQRLTRAVQTTLRGPVRLSGHGLHSGAPVTLVLRPARAGQGLRFRRMDLPGQPEIAALWSNVVASALNTRIESAGAHVLTIEHLMAAMAGTGLTNALIEIDGPEVPILDGSARPFAEAILSAGLRPLTAPLSVIEVRETVEVRDGAAFARLEPADRLRIDFTIDFAEPGIGRQALALDMGNGAFLRELCQARTFCLAGDIDRMRAEGRALGGSLDNAVVFGDGRVLNPGGLRIEREPVRHKMLDALGDLATAGAPILGRFVAERGGHGLTNRLLRKLFDTQGAWARVQAGAETAAHLPGAGVSAADIEAVA